jgi:hypothetical protein
VPGALSDRRREVGSSDLRVDDEVVDLLDAKVLQAGSPLLELLTSELERLRAEAVVDNDRE